MKLYMLHTCIDYSNSYEIFPTLQDVRQDIVDWVIDNRGDGNEDDDEEEAGDNQDPNIGLDDVRRYFEDNTDESMTVLVIDTEKLYATELDDKEVFSDEHSG